LHFSLRAVDIDELFDRLRHLTLAVASEAACIFSLTISLVSRRAFLPPRISFIIRKAITPFASSARIIKELIISPPNALCRIPNILSDFITVFQIFDQWSQGRRGYADFLSRTRYRLSQRRCLLKFDFLTNSGN
jgi:hypothetical protein